MASNALHGNKIELPSDIGQCPDPISGHLCHWSTPETIFVVPPQGIVRLMP
jgi:hypothetical protein